MHSGTNGSAHESGLVVEALDCARAMADEINRVIAGRAIVFSMGPEVLTGQIRDTNKPWIAQHLRASGFTITEGRNLPDDRDVIAAALREAGEELGFGLIVTTGGVGAEGKDTTVEALLAVGQNVATPTLFGRPFIPKRSRPDQCSGMLLKLQLRRVVDQSESGDAR